MLGMSIHIIKDAPVEYHSGMRNIVLEETLRTIDVIHNFGVIKHIYFRQQNRAI
jgi:hypothetical protein